MKRFVIAMLALLTGLVVQAAPAAARAGGLAVGAEVGAVTGARAAKAAREAQVVADSGCPETPVYAELEPAVPQGESGYAVLTVHLGPDRARE